MEELINKNIDLCAIKKKPRRKVKAEESINHYIRSCNGVKKEDRERAGVGIHIHKEKKLSLNNYRYISEIIIHMDIKIDQQNCL